MLRMPRRFPIDFNDRVQVHGRFGIVADVLPSESAPLYRVVWVGNTRESQDTRSDWLPASSLRRVVGCAQPGRRVRHTKTGRLATVLRVLSHREVWCEMTLPHSGKTVVRLPAWELRPAAFPQRTPMDVTGIDLDAKDRAA